jgi:orotate phosphoribosyltransferase
MEAAEKVKAEGGNVVGYACIIDRSGGMFSGDNGGELGNPLWSAFQAGME